MRLMPGRMHEVELVEAADEPARSRPAPSPSLTRPADHVDVELDDVDGAPRDDADRRVDAARTWLRRHARWLVPVAAVAVVALVGTQVVADQREAARVAALAAIPGVVPPADSSIGVLWRADPRLAAALQSGSVVDGTFVGGTQSADGALSIVGLDPDTGVIAWTTPVDTLTPPRPTVGTSPSVWVSCTPVAHGGSPVAACITQQYGAVEALGVPESTIVVLDPADGSLLAQRSVPGTTGITFTDHDVVLADRVSDDGSPAPTDASSVRWAVTASDIVSGTQAWTWTSPAVDVLGREDGPQAANATGSATLETVDGQLLLAVDQHAWILSAAGKALRDVPLPEGAWIGPARSGVFVQNTWSSAEQYQGNLILADGTQVPIDETVGWLAVDDGSAPDVVFTVGSGPGNALGLSGRSARTGAQLWHLQGSVNTGVLLDGTLYVATNEALLAVDATTGHTLWRTPLDHVVQQVSTDGRYLLVPGLNVTLDAYSMRDGSLAWHKDLAKEVAGDRSTVFVQGFQAGWHDPRLYVWMDDGGVAVLG